MMTGTPETEINGQAEEKLPASPPEKRKALRTVTCGAIFAGAVAIAFFLWPARSGAKTESAPVELPVVAAARVVRQEMASELVFYSELRPYQEVELHAKVAGYVDVINVDVGDHVKEGQLIARLELPEVRDDLERSEATQRRSEQEIRRAQVAFEDANTNFSRLLAIDKATTNLIAQQDIDTATARDRSAEADFAAAREQAKVAAAEVKKLRTMLHYAEITAPFEGIITKRYADKGSLIQAGTSSSTQAMPLVRLSQNGLLRLVFPVQSRWVSNIKAGDPVEIEFASLSRKMQAKITRSTQEVDTSTRDMDVEVDIPNPDFSLIPGMFGSVRLKVNRRPNALVVPITSVARKGEPSVYLINKNNTIEERHVKIGAESPSHLEILSGLEEGDLVMIGNRSEVRPGEKVTAKMITDALPEAL
jgi:RND family efflux transporter MFP subunit